jgi:predicted translin family RNA/ssDNA-binding protein
MGSKHFSTDKKRKYTFKRNNTKVDSIHRLTLSLKRDIDRLTGNTTQTLEKNSGIDQNHKLDIIANTLLEIRDRIEKHFNSFQYNNCMNQVSNNYVSAQTQPINYYNTVPNPQTYAFNPSNVMGYQLFGYY